MQGTRPHRRVPRSQRGLTFIELMIASLILVVSLMGLMSVWMTAFSVTRGSDEVTVAYNIARANIDRVRSHGYLFATEGTTVRWYDSNGNETTAPGTGYYRVEVTVVSGLAVAAHLLPKEVIVEVRRASTGATLYQARSYLVLGGS